ncbi:hypothetical protein [Embleya sp. NPDC059237]|uniref:VMAP-C domain-containing protein n=1 Tax=Embleya sp. NPDC059237 TaxID=3346784 RepID=UPI0036BFB014
MTVHALFVCVEHYPAHEGGPGDLPGALAQTLELVEWLHTSGASGAERITVLASVRAASEPTAERLRELIAADSILVGPGAGPGELQHVDFERVLGGIGEHWRDGDRFLLHWTGHGRLDAHGRWLELPAFHLAGDSRLAVRAIAVDELLARCGEVPRRVDQFLVFETCADRRGEPGAIPLNLTAAGPSEKSAKARISAVFAADDGQFAYRPADRPAFTTALIEHLTLRGPDALTVPAFREMFDEIDTRLAASGPAGRPLRQSPMYRGPGTADWREGERDPENQFGLYRHRLLALLADLDIGAGEPAVLRTYLRERGVPEWVFAGADLPAWGAALMSLPGPPGRHPIRHLLEWLYAGCHQTHVADWAEQLREAGHIDAFRPAEVRERQPLTLVVFIRENAYSSDGPDRVRYDAEPRFYVGLEHFEAPPGLPSGTGLPRERLADHLADFYLTIRTGWTSLAKARVQLVLPTELFNEPFEAVRIGGADDHIVLGEHHEVVLRPIVRHGVARPMHYDTWAESANLRANPAVRHLNRHLCGGGSHDCEDEAVGFLQDYRWEHRPDRPGAVESAVGRGDWALLWTHGTTCTDACAGTNGAHGGCSGAAVGRTLYRMLEQKNRNLTQLPSAVTLLRRTLGRRATPPERVVLVFDDPGWRPWQGAGLLRGAPAGRGDER